MLSAYSAEALLDILPEFISELCLILRSLGFLVNWGEGKTEAFVSLRGRKAIEISRDLADSGNSVAIDPLCGASQIRLVEQYKHLGSMLDASMSHNPDVDHRVQSAMTSYVPIAFKVFGAREICRPVRLRLFYALIISRLIYNVHLWTNVPLRHYRRLNAVYMRGLRMIANKSRFSKKSSAGIKDHDIRYSLGAMSFQCMLTRRRLLLLGQVVCYGNFQLHSLLATSRLDGTKLPWVQTVISDLRLLYDHKYNKVSELGDPIIDAEKWWTFIREFPQQWRQLVKGLHITTMALDSEGKTPYCDKTITQNSSHTCRICGCGYLSSKALQAHIRVKHSKISNVARFVGTSLKCCVCGLAFSTRPRLIAHLADKRRSGCRKITCHDVVSAGYVEQIREDELEQATMSDRKLRRDARRRGFTQPRSAGRPKRARQSSSLCQTSLDSTGTPPSNAFDWRTVRPLKRLRTKASPDSLLVRVF